MNVQQFIHIAVRWTQQWTIHRFQMPNASNTRLMLLEVIVPLLIGPLLIPWTDSPKTTHIAWQPSSAILTCFSSPFLWPLPSSGNFSIEPRQLCPAAAPLDTQKKPPTHSTSRWNECYGCKTWKAVLILTVNGFSVILYHTLCSLVLM